jgi:hypothetical protein
MLRQAKIKQNIKNWPKLAPEALNLPEASCYKVDNITSEI